MMRVERACQRKGALAYLAWLVHLPVHPSWLDQIFFSILQARC